MIKSFPTTELSLGLLALHTSLAAVPSNLSCTVKVPRDILRYAIDWIVCHIKNFQTLELDDVLWNFSHRISTKVEDLQMWKLEDGAGQLV